MRDSERTRLREREPAPANDYEISYQYLLKLRERGFTGKVVVDGEQQHWQMNRQGRGKWFLSRENDKGTALKDWTIFARDIRIQSGKHRHQGGLAIFVLEGEGYTEIDGERIEWEAGDLILLPIKPDGIEHQHFNRDLQKGCKWIAFVFRPYMDSLSHYIEQTEVAPDYQP